MQPASVFAASSFCHPLAATSDAAVSANMPSSSPGYVILAAALFVALIGSMVAYLVRLNRQLGRGVVLDVTACACVPWIGRAMRAAARATAVFAIALPVFVLLGWTLRSPAMVSIVPGLAAMNPMVAVSLLMCGAGLWAMLDGTITAHRAARLVGIIVAGIAAAKLVGFVTGVDSNVDQALFAHRLDLVPGLPPKRMSPNTAVALLLLGSALALLDVTTRRGRRPAELLAIPAALVAILGLVGYLYSVTSLYHMRTFLPMALHTAVAVLALSIGLLMARPDRGLMAIVTSDSVGGVIARRLLPATILVPVALGWLRVIGQHLGFADVDFGVSLVILGDIAFFVLLVWSTAALLRRSDARRLQVEAALGRERNLLRSLLDNLPDHIFIKDAAGRYITDNIAHARFVGLSGPEEVVGKTVGDFFPPELAAKFMADDQRILSSGEPLVSRVEPITEHDGSRRWVATTKVPIRDVSGAVSGLVCISRDITEQVRADELLREQYAKVQELANSERDAHQTLKRAQSQLVQSEKLAGLGQLVAGVAHEINNPLSFVSNNVAVLQRDAAAIGKLVAMYRQADSLVLAGNPELMAEIRDLCERLDISYTLSNIGELTMRSRDGLKRIQQIVKDLRDFARLDESDLKEIDLNQGVDSTVNIIRGRAKSKQVTLELDLQPLPMIACFPAKINQVIMNLVSNAIDACETDGKVTVRTSAADGNGGGVRIEVSDTGCGISPAVRERIFDPFFTTKKQGEGTGLGLSISYGIVQDHGGTIEVDSTVGKGSRFTVALPARPAGKREKQRI